MADTKVTIHEIRLFIDDPELTQVYVRMSSDGGLIGVDGWHHKTFAASAPVAKLFTDYLWVTDDLLMWPLNAPPGNGR